MRGLEPDRGGERDMNQKVMRHLVMCRTRLLIACLYGYSYCSTAICHVGLFSVPASKRTLTFDMSVVKELCEKKTKTWAHFLE